MVIIPARDEAPRIGAVVEGARRSLPGVTVVVVENGSADDTGAEAERAGATVIRSGVGYAVATRAGFVYARDHGAVWVVTMDGDGQHPAEALPGMVAALAHADVVVGSRFMTHPGYAVPPLRRAANAALGAWTSLLAGQRLHDVTSGLRALRRPVVERFAADYPSDVADGNVLVRALRLGWTVTEVPVTMRERAGGVSQHRGTRGAWFALRMAAYAVQERLAAN